MSVCVYVCVCVTLQYLEWMNFSIEKNMRKNYYMNQYFINVFYNNFDKVDGTDK